MEQVTMKEETILKIARYKCQLAELDRQWWFEDLDSKFWQVNHDRIKEEIRRLEND
tara:strand:- start:870 stop:1037 length:168 start_codon:yes stop_codon:yes gene_type:complete